jgi:penicillin-binding protein 2
VVRAVPFAEKHLEAVSKGLEAAVNERRGTAWASRLEELRFAGKTGTAQVVKLKEKMDKNRDEKDIPYRFRDHALFVAYAPATHPELAVAVVVEHGSHGSSVAAPITQAIFRHYFDAEAPSQEVSAGD